MQDVLEFVLKNIVTVPDDIKIEVAEEEGTTNYIVTVNSADVGRIIGKEGKVIKAIRTIMRVIAIQRGIHVRVSVVSENDAPAVASDETVGATLAVARETTAPTATEAVKEEDDGSITVEV